MSLRAPDQIAYYRGSVIEVYPSVEPVTLSEVKALLVIDGRRRCDFDRHDRGGARVYRAYHRHGVYHARLAAVFGPLAAASNALVGWRAANGDQRIDRAKFIFANPGLAFANCKHGDSVRG